MSDTPRTNAVMQFISHIGFIVSVEDCRELERELTAAKAEVERLRALIRLDDAEWCDKHMYPSGGETFQQWLVSVYLPVPLSEQDKSPEAALERALKETK